MEEIDRIAGGSVMVWGENSVDSTPNFVVFPRRVNADRYIIIVSALSPIYGRGIKILSLLLPVGLSKGSKCRPVPLKLRDFLISLWRKSTHHLRVVSS